MKPEEESKTAVITGSTAGIGRAIAKSLAADDINIVVTGRRAEPEVEGFLHELAKVARGRDHCYIRGDISDETTRQEIRDTIQRRFPGPSTVFQKPVYR